jgi:DNA adenine methylase
MSGNRVEKYEEIKASYNSNPNAADLLFLSRSCYGGVVRFRMDGYISTPCGIHQPISPASFQERVEIWHDRIQGVAFIDNDFETIMDQAQPGDMVYCDPPYTHTQAILYGAQSFSLERLFRVIARCKNRGVYVALSIDGTKKTGKQKLPISFPHGLFEREASVNCGRSMLRRFQMEGETLEDEVVTDRLLLTY